MIRIPAFGNGSRRWCSAKGSSLDSVVVIRTPGEVGGRDAALWLTANRQPLRQLVLKSLSQPARDRAGSTFADRLIVDPDDREDLDRRPEQDHLVRGQ